MSCTIVATIIAKPYTVEFIKAELEKLIPISWAEDGCQIYDLHQDNETPQHFLFYERWASRALW